MPMNGIRNNVLVVVAVILCVATTLVASAEPLGTLQLPRSLYKSIAGGWNVDLYSPCGSYMTGTITFANETAVVRWSDEGFGLTLTPFEDSKAMDASGLSRYVSKQEDDVSAPAYRICERLENSVSTPRRPGAASALRVTQLYDFAGAFESADTDVCQDSTARPVHIRAMGSPLVTSLYSAEQKGQIEYMEITVDFGAVPGACSSTRSEETVAVPRESGAGRGRRKRSAARTVARPGVASSVDSADASVPSGVLVMRFAMSTPPPKTVFQRLSPIIMFACMFVIMRIVYGFSSAKAAKS